MTIDELIAQHDLLDEEVNIASDHLHKVSKGHIIAMGLVSDEFCDTPEYREAKSNFNRAFNTLRSFNQQANKNKELREYLDTRSRERRFSTK